MPTPPVHVPLSEIPAQMRDGLDRILETKDGIYAAGPGGFAESTKLWFDRVEVPALARRGTVLDPWLAYVQHILDAPVESRAPLWADLGDYHYETILGARRLVADLNQEPPDNGTVCEVAWAAAHGVPVVAYRNDLRTIGEDGLPFDYMTAAAVRRSGGAFVSRFDEVEGTGLLNLDMAVPAPHHAAPCASGSTPANGIFLATPCGHSEVTRLWLDSVLTPIARGAGAPIDPSKTPTQHISDAPPHLRAEMWMDVGDSHYDAVRRSRVVVAVLDGEPPDNRVVCQTVWAAAHGIPVIGYRNDTRTCGEDGMPFNLMLAAAVRRSGGEMVSGVDDLIRSLDRFARRRTDGHAARLVAGAGRRARPDFRAR